MKKNEEPPANLKDLLESVLEVRKWLDECEDVDHRDRRMGSLLVSVRNFQNNAAQQWPSPAGRRKHYEKLNQRLSKLADEMATDAAPSIKRYASDIAGMAKTAKSLSDLACDDGGHIWSQAKPNIANSARNDFLRALSQWMRTYHGKDGLANGEPHHNLVAAIVTKLFEGKTRTAEEVQRLAR